MTLTVVSETRIKALLRWISFALSLALGYITIQFYDIWKNEMDRTTLMEAVGEISKCTANSYSNNLGISNHFTIDSIVDDVSFRVSVNSTYAERFMKLCNSKSSYHLFYQYNSINKLNWIINITESSGKVVFESGVSHGGDWRKVAMSVLFLIFGLVAIYLLLVAIGIKSMKNETIKIVSTFIRRW